MKCPTEEQLACLVEGKISLDQRREMEAHFSECDRCLEDWTSTLGVVRGEEEHAAIDDLESMTDRAVLIAKRKLAAKGNRIEQRIAESAKTAVEWISEHLEIPFQKMKLMPVRSSRKKISDDLIHLHKTFKDFNTSIEIEKRRDRHLIRVRLSEKKPASRSIRVTLEKEGREISSELFESGDVLFEDVPAGHYRLLFNRDGEAIGIYQFQIRESANG